ncbi:GNAT family N-acetyltransferase [Phenylobacterium deserti]|uniref:GNAT family N-acetyltransferase n=1 Tax=Phenylobacterium deserti TaxID=1914756 RepID=A0A328A8M4_9CAUL|nr:GNAT family N-acetyltransferase [Phenylobacterium deserti]RAK50962.1 GNAT family N-acetyltransferase [Phenylobacterium deserti]
MRLDVDVEGVERATVSGVAPSEVVEIDGWLVPLDAGAIGRAKSAVPLRHDLGAAALDEIEAAYRSRGLEPAFRIADLPGLADLRAALARRGYAPTKPTVVKIGNLDRLAALSRGAAEVLDRPDAGWASVFTGEGFDPADGASRVSSLSRSPGALYGCVREGSRTVAVGVASLEDAWTGLHGLRTAVAHRGRGHAAAVMSALASAARDRAAQSIFLQVEAANPARNLYRRAGFEFAWLYEYWVRT